MSVTVLAKNTCATTGEGPFWEESTKSLLYVDILAGDVHRWNTTTNSDSKIHLDDDVSFIIPRSRGDGYVIGLGKSLAFLDWDKGTTEKIVGVEEGTNNRFNDAKCDPSGRLWAGTMGQETEPANPEPQMGSLYSLDKSRTLKKHVDKIDISNGLAWSLDNKTMYYIDSLPRKVYAFDFDLASGTISNQRTAVDFNVSSVAELGFPDGMCSDVEGKLWVACYAAGKVIRFDPETGKQLQTINFPAKRITSCCFGGPNYDELYVTCGKTGLSEEEFSSQQPLAGSVFKVTGLGVRGSQAASFIED
jgi:gluconolactonase